MLGKIVKHEWRNLSADRTLWAVGLLLVLTAGYSLRSPSFCDYDVTLRKSFAIGDRAKLDLEGSAFNILNHPNFAKPIAVLSDVRFGQIIGSRSGSSPRQMQSGLRLGF